MSPQTGYAVANIAALKAIGSSDRADKYSLLVSEDAYGSPAWFTFHSFSTRTANNVDIIAPNSGTGRWLKVRNGGWRLIHSGSISNVSNYTISNLDGNTDAIYQILLHGQLSSNTETRVSLLPNGITSNLGYQFHLTRNDNYHNVNSGSMPGFYLVSNEWESDHALSCTATLYAKSGTARTLVSQISNYQTELPYIGNAYAGIARSTWSDTTTNLTSLVLYFDSAVDFEGNIYLLALGG